MKTHWKKLKNPDYLGSWDLADSEGVYHNKVVTLGNVSKKFVHDGKGGGDECVVAEIAGLKPMILNSTNLKTISKLLDSDFIEDWKGKKIELTVAKVKAFGETHDALRVSKVKPVAKQKLDFTPDKFENAHSKGATIDKIKSIYNVTPEIEKQYADFIASVKATS